MIVDLVFDAVGGETLSRSMAVVKPGGKLVSIAGQPSENDARARDIEAPRILVHTSRDQLAQIADLIDQGVLTPTVEHQLPPSEAREAHRLSEERHVRGKIVLVP